LVDVLSVSTSHVPLGQLSFMAELEHRVAVGGVRSTRRGMGVPSASSKARERQREERKEGKEEPTLAADPACLHRPGVNVRCSEKVVNAARPSKVTTTQVGYVFKSTSEPDQQL
jgi:hypothetical protein